MNRNDRPRSEGATFTPDPLPSQADAVVIGSGIFGAASAYNLAAAGVNVVVVERGDFCGEASGANVGLVTISTKPPGLLLDLALRTASLYPTLNDTLGRWVHYERTGGLNVAVTPEGLEERRALTELQRSVGVEVYHVTGDELREMEPLLPKSVLGGSYCPNDGVVYPFAAVAAFLERAHELGMRFVPRTEATGIEVRDGRVSAVRTSRGTIRTSHVINAGGAWAGLVSEMAGLNTPVIPVRGQVLVTEPVDGLPERVILGVEPSIRKTWAGNGVIGSTKEYAGFEKRTTPATIRHFAQGITEMYPDLKDVQIIRAWSGLRPSTPDEMPILGESERVRGFVLAAGGFRNGMLYGPAVGEVIRDVVLGKDPAIDISEARPERFESSPVAVTHNR
jgi:glycine/D-amino acid oxidase-like deaminating enzyme